MKNRAEEMVRRWFLDPFEHKSEPYQVGVEVELPLVNLEKRPVEPEFAQELVSYLQQRFDFQTTARTTEGYPAKAENPAGDAFSFETSFNTIEFSMAKNRSVSAIAERFYSYLSGLQLFAKERNYFICGMGINPYAQYADASALNTPILQAKATFLRRFTSHRNGEIFHAFSASTQTHLETNLSSLPERLNLFGKLSFVDALLFSNSLPFQANMENGWIASLPHCLQAELNQPTLCFRDTLWRLCEAPNTEASEQTFTSVDDVVRHLLSLKLFVVSDGGEGYRPIRPAECAEYFSDENPAHADGARAEKDFRCFRPLQPVSVSRYGTIEIRQTCTQPLAEIFTPTAFYVGIAENFENAHKLTDDFWRENQLHVSNVQLRQMAVYGEKIVSRRRMETFLKELVAVAEEGLARRNLGEERFLARLLKREGGFECPAKRQIRLQQEGCSHIEIMRMFSETDNGNG
ncbi:MAG: hypothetical protein ABFD11_13505 [Christensenella sp.]